MESTSNNSNVLNIYDPELNEYYNIDLNDEDFQRAEEGNKMNKYNSSIIIIILINFRSRICCVSDTKCTK